MKISGVYGLWVALVVSSACGSSGPKDHRSSDQSNRIEPRLLDLKWSAPGLKQQLAVGPVSHLSTLQWSDNTYSHEVAFKVTSLFPEAHCFISLGLRPEGGRGAQSLKDQAYISGSLMKLDSVSTKTCLEPGETGYLLTFLNSDSEQLTGLSLESINTDSIGSTPELIKEVSVLSKTIHERILKVVLKNESLATGFNSLGFTEWVIEQGDTILEWGYLETSIDWNLPFVGLGETVEVSRPLYLNGSLPPDASIRILLDKMSLSN